MEVRWFLQWGELLSQLHIDGVRSPPELSAPLRSGMRPPTWATGPSRTTRRAAAVELQGKAFGSGREWSACYSANYLHFFGKEMGQVS